MSIKEITLKEAKNGWIISYWKAPPKAKGQPENCCGMGENIQEVFTDKDAAAKRITELS